MAQAASSDDDDGFDMPEYAAAAARAQAARSKDEDNASYRGRYFRPPSGEVRDYVDIEATERSRSRSRTRDESA